MADIGTTKISIEIPNDKQDLIDMANFIINKVGASGECASDIANENSVARIDTVAANSRNFGAMADEILKKIKRS